MPTIQKCNGFGCLSLRCLKGDTWFHGMLQEVGDRSTEISQFISCPFLHLCLIFQIKKVQDKSRSSKEDFFPIKILDASEMPKCSKPIIT